MNIRIVIKSKHEWPKYETQAQLEEVAMLSETGRGSGGFGKKGK
jgi:dUTPase